MNILAEVQKEHSKAICNRVVAYVGSSQPRFRELVGIYLAGPYRVTQRSAWPISCCVERHPELVKPHLSRLIAYLRKPGTSDAVKRNTVRLMQFISIPRGLQGRVAGICFDFLQDTRQPIAVRCFSMTVLANIAKDQPALGKELRIILEDTLPYASAGMAARAKRILKDI